MREKRRLLSLIIVLLFFSTGATVAAQDAPPSITVKVTPGTVALPPQGKVKVVVVAHNPSSDTLSNVRLSWFTDVPVDVSVTAPPADTLAPLGVLEWTLELAQRGPEPASGTVHLQIDYRWQDEERASPTAQVAFGSLQVKPRALQPVDQIATVAVQTSLSELMQHRPGWVYLVVTNPSNRPIRVKEIVPYGPDFVTFEPPRATVDVPLDARAAHSFPVEVKAGDQVRPGAHLLLFEVVLEWQEAGRTWEGRLTATHPVQVGIVGESALLKLVGVPTLLVLPGFLILITLGGLWRLYWPKQPEWRLGVKTPEFWALAIALSLMIALVVYPLLTTWWFDQPRNYLGGYGLRDITYVWVGSIVLTLLVYLMAAGCYQLGRRVLERCRKWRARHRPTAQDSPLELLQKLGHQGRISIALNVLLNKFLSRKLGHQDQGQGIVRYRVAFTRAGQPQRGFLLEPRTNRREKLWVGPPIVIEWLGEADVAFQQRVERQLGPEGDVAHLARLLAQGVQKRLLRVRWKGTAYLKAPCALPQAEFQDLTPGFMIYQE
jgi:hypothetical protein